MSLPLQGVRILSQGIVWAGPFATLMLADMGAEVIEVENIRHLNPTRTNDRHIPPEVMQGPRGNIYARRDPTGRFWDRQGYFNYGKRNCLSVTIDIAQPHGRELFLRLAAKADIFLENNAADVVERWNIDYPDVSQANPGIIMLRFPGFGTTGPYKHFKGYGANVEAVVGHTALRGYRDSDPSLTPAIFHADPAAGAHGVFAILSALYYRERTGLGQLVDMSQGESVIHHLSHAFMDYSMNQRVQGHWGNRHPFMAPYGLFPCRGDDYWIALAAPNDETFSRLCAIMGRLDLAEDPRYADAVSRYHHQDELEETIAAWTKDQDQHELMVCLQGAGVPAAAVLKQTEMHQNPHLAARGYFETVTHREAGTHPYPGPLAKFTQNPLHIRTPAPCLGEHNEYVLKEVVGVSEAEYEELLQKQIIGDTYTEDAR